MRPAPQPLERTLDLPTLVAYAGATWDWYGTHYDPTAIAASGLPGPLVDGQMLGALLAEQALDWAPPGSRVVGMAFRFRSMVFAGDTVRCEAEVDSESKEEGRVRLRQKVRVGDRLAIDEAWTDIHLPT